MRIKSLIFTAVLATVILFSGGAIKAVDNSALIAQLQAQIASLLAQIQTLKGDQFTGTGTWCYDFNKNLGVGSNGEEVQALGIALEKSGFGATGLAENLISPVSDDGVFIETTAMAVVKFQKKYGINASGFVGPVTRAKLNKLYGCGSDLDQKNCKPDWQCNYSKCVDGYQTPMCSDLNRCGVSTGKLTTKIACDICSSWVYSDWSPEVCPSYGTQSRTVLNALPADCTGGNPVLTKTCTYVKTPPITSASCTPGTTQPCSGGIKNCTASGEWTNCVIIQASSKAVCGSSNGISTTTKPTTGLCTSGTVSSVVQEGRLFLWDCTPIPPYGNIGVAYCSATIPASSDNGVCGPASKAYNYTDSAFVGALCSVGTASPSIPSFPTPSNIVNWQCVGSNGVSARCGASRGVPIGGSMVNGVCGTVVNSCTSGYSAPNSNGTWLCAGSGGGETVGCPTTR